MPFYIIFYILFYVFRQSKETLPHELNHSAGSVLSLGSVSLEFGPRSSPTEFGREHELLSRTVAGNQVNQVNCREWWGTFVLSLWCIVRVQQPPDERCQVRNRRRPSYELLRKTARAFIRGLRFVLFNTFVITLLSSIRLPDFYPFICAL